MVGALYQSLALSDYGSLTQDLASDVSPYTVSATGPVLSAASPSGSVTCAANVTVAGIGPGTAELLAVVAAVNSAVYPANDPVTLDFAAAAGTPGLTWVDLTNTTVGGGYELRVSVPSDSPNLAAIIAALQGLGALLSHQAVSVALSRDAALASADPPVVVIGPLSSTVGPAQPPAPPLPPRAPPPPRPSPWPASWPRPPPPPQLLIIDQLFAIAGMPPATANEVGYTFVIADAVASALAALGIQRDAVSASALSQAVSAEAIAEPLRRALAQQDAAGIITGLAAAFSPYSVAGGEYDAYQALYSTSAAAAGAFFGPAGPNAGVVNFTGGYLTSRCSRFCPRCVMTPLSRLRITTKMHDWLKKKLVSTHPWCFLPQ